MGFIKSDISETFNLYASITNEQLEAELGIKISKEKSPFDDLETLCVREFTAHEKRPDKECDSTVLLVYTKTNVLSDVVVADTRDPYQIMNIDDLSDNTHNRLAELGFANSETLLSANDFWFYPKTDQLECGEYAARRDANTVYLDSVPRNIALLAYAHRQKDVLRPWEEFTFETP